MDKNYLLYGTLSDDVRGVAQRVEKLIGKPLQERDSIHWGDYFMTAGGKPDEVSVYANEDPEDHEPHFEEYAEYRTLISIYDSTMIDEHDRILTSDPELSAELLIRDIH